MNPLTVQQERKTKKDCGTRRGRHSTIFLSAFDQPSSSHLNDDDDDGNDEGTLRASTPSPTRVVSSLTNENNFFISNSSKCTIENFIHKSNLIKPREHFSSFQSKLQILPPSSNEPTYPQPLNPLLDNISDVPPRPLNPQLLQSYSSFDITLSLSPITPLDHIHDTPSPPSPP
ncbi:hypothetical protein Tco_1188588 [Tanacetum coccineum]